MVGTEERRRHLRTWGTELHFGAQSPILEWRKQVRVGFLVQWVVAKVTVVVLCP